MSRSQRKRSKSLRKSVRPAHGNSGSPARPPAVRWRFPAVPLAGILNWLMPCLIALFPAALLLRLHNTFGMDWNNHVWIAGYSGEYFIHHGRFPLTINTDQLTGLPYPLFYGFLFYPIAGLFSIPLGADLAIRVICFLVLWLQTIQLTKVFTAAGAGRLMSWAVAAIVSFAIYPLTNLYNRSAITEFVAVSLLVSAFCIWIQTVWRIQELGVWRSGAVSILLLTLAAGTHPITALFGVGAFAAAASATFLFCADRAKLWRIGLINTTLFIVVVSPWIYVALRFQSEVAVAQESAKGIAVFIHDIDKPSVRFSPLPYDVRPSLYPLDQISTPYLDTQMNMSLLLLIGFLTFEAIRQARAANRARLRYLGVSVAFIAAAMAIAYCSVAPGVWVAFPKALRILQFSYRAVAYVDFLLLCGVICLIAFLSRDFASIQRRVSIYLALSVALSCAGVIVKFQHAEAVSAHRPLPASGFLQNRADLKRFPLDTFYGAGGYVVTKGFAGIVPSAESLSVPLPTSAGTYFGQVSVQPYTVRTRAFLFTNVQAFPWNVLVLNGKDVPLANTFVTPFYTLAVPVKPGPGTIWYRFSPPVLWLFLRILSTIALLLWSAALLFRVQIKRPAILPSSTDQPALLGQ
jgi:hypothetical protein